MLNLFNLSLILKGFDINQAKKDLEKLKGLSTSEFTKNQEKIKESIYQYHIENSLWYKDFVIRKRGYYPDKWEDIPIIKKKDLQKPIERRLSQDFKLNDVRIHNTSGSTGQPFFFAKDKYCHSMTWASILDRYAWHNVDYGSSKQARFYGIPLGFPKYQKERLKDVLSNRFRFTVFDLSDQVLDGFIESFRKEKFEYINGYASSIVLFCKRLIERGIVLEQICPTLKVVFPTSEMCSIEDRKTIEKATGVKVANEYGAAELDVIAFEDQDYDWVLNEENLFVEIVDDENNVVEDGRPGRVIITSLYNKANSFIRYEVGDIGSIRKERKGKYRILENLIGRTNDIIILPSGKRSPGLTFYYISKSLLEGGGGMKEFIIKQKSLDSFHFEYVADSKISQKEQEAIQASLDKYLELGLHATFEKKEVIKRTAAGKIKHFHREF